MNTGGGGTEDGGDRSGRSLVGFVTVTGSLETGLGSSIPKAAALHEGLESGDQLRVEHDSIRGEIILIPTG